MVEGADGEFDLVFSNAAMQWVGDHAATYPKLMGRVAPGGALAVQVPCNFDAPAHRLMRELAASEKWRGRLSRHVREWHVHEAAFYYDVMAPCSARVDIWHTEYIHILPDSAGIVEWYKGTGLRPFLDALASDESRGEFLAEYTKLIEGGFGRQADGKVLFPFQRLFLIAYRG
jgi:trans-aconitate 2-methyltransferase